MRRRLMCREALAAVMRIDSGDIGGAFLPASLSPAINCKYAILYTFTSHAQREVKAVRHLRRLYTLGCNFPRAIYLQLALKYETRKYPNIDLSLGKHLYGAFYILLYIMGTK